MIRKPPCAAEKQNRVVFPRLNNRAAKRRSTCRRRSGCRRCRSSAWRRRNRSADPSRSCPPRYRSWCLRCPDSGPPGPPRQDKRTVPLSSHLSLRGPQARGNPPPKTRETDSHVASLLGMTGGLLRGGRGHLPPCDVLDCLVWTGCFAALIWGTSTVLFSH